MLWHVQIVFNDANSLSCERQNSSSVFTCKVTVLALLAWFASVITYGSIAEFESNLLANAENMFTVFSSYSKRIVMNRMCYVSVLICVLALKPNSCNYVYVHLVRSVCSYQWILVISVSLAKEYCKVTFAFEASNEDELTLKEGDIIHILSKVRFHGCPH